MVARRWYGDACGTALALELIGERWALLVMRELMFGGRRFGQLRASLTGISANILTQRLESLEGIGLVLRRSLAPLDAGNVYELTPWGYQSEEAMRCLGRWAVMGARPDVTLPLSPAAMMMSFRTLFSPVRAQGLDFDCALDFGSDAFTVGISEGIIEIVRGKPSDCSVGFVAGTKALAEVVYAGRALAVAEAAGDLIVLGDRRLAELFCTLFPLPELIEGVSATG